MRAVTGGGRIAAAALAWLGGVGWQLQEPALQPPATYAGMALAALLVAAGSASAFGRVRQARGGVGRSVSACLVVACVGVAGFCCAGLQASLRGADALATRLEGRDLVVTGTVASLPQRGANGVRFRFDIDDEARAQAEGRLPPRIALGWYAGLHEDAALTAPQRELRAGQRWRFTVRLRRPHGNLNPNGYDWELQLFEQGLRATGYVRDAPPPQLVAETAAHPVERLRQRVRDAIDAQVSDRRAAGVLAALAIGDQGAIERDDWELFRNTGIAHLVSISGLHVTMFAWLAGLVIAWLWRRSERAMLWLPAASAARWGGLLAAAAYALFSGWGVPAQRTVWMLAVVCLLRGGGVRWPWTFVLLAAAVVVTTLDPWSMTQPGFWLSFAAVGLLMMSTPATASAETAGQAADGENGWRGWPRRLLGHAGSGVRTQIVATLGLAPLTLVFFQQLSLVGFLANLVAIPLVTLVVTPLALLGAALPFAAAPLWWLGSAAVQSLAAFLGALAAWPGAVWIVPVAPRWAQAAGLLAALLVVLPLPWRLRVAAVALALPLLAPVRVLPGEGRFDLVAADVGQGTAVLVRTRSHVLLFDAGPQYARDSDAGQRVLVPLLRGRGDGHVDLMILSHRDLDHVGGAKAVLAALDVGQVSSSLEASHPVLVAAGPRAKRCEAGQRWTWDGVDFTVLRPAAGDYALALKSNAMSCVLRIAGRDRSALVAGDIEKEQEAQLVAGNDAAALRSDVLVVPHHGSKTSSTAALLDVVRPRLAIVQSGYRNRFGHPAAEVVERYRARGIAVIDTPSCGAWLWLADGPDAGRCQRDLDRRYWHD